MPDQSLEIAIKTTADVAGALKVKASLEEQILKAKLLGESFEKQTEQLRNVNRALEEYKAQGGEVAKEAEHMEVSHRELHRLFGMMGRESVPELGEAMTGLLYGPAGALLIVAAAATYLKKQLDAVQEAAEKFAALKWSAQIDSINEARQSADGLADALEKAARANDPIKSQYDQQLAVLNAHVTAHKEILKAMEAEELAAAKGDKGKEDEIKHRYAGQETAYDKITEEEKRRQQDAERQTYESAAVVAKGESELIGKQLAGAENDPNFIGARNRVENITDDDKKKIAEARALVEKSGGKDAVRKMEVPDVSADVRAQAVAMSHGIPFSATPAIDQAAEVEKKKKALSLLDEYDQQAAVIAEQTETIKRLKKAQEEAASEAKRNTAAARDLKAAQGTERKTRDQTDAGADVGKAIGIEQKVLAGGEINKGEEEFLRTIGTVIAGHNVTLQTAEKMFAVASKNNDAMDSMMNRLADTMGKMSDTVLKSFNANIGRIERDIKNLESRLKNSYNQ